MKPIIPASILFLLPFFATAQTVSVLDAPPPQANINQPVVFNTTAEITEGTQARYQSSGTNTLRGVTQVFTWNSDAPLAAVGIMAAPDQNTPGGCAFVRKQTYTLDIQELDAAGKVVATVASATIALTPAVVQSGKYMQITPAAPAPLVKGKPYGFHLCPVSIDRANRLLVGFSGYKHAGGRGLLADIGPGNQTGGYYDAAAGAYAALPTGARYGTNGGGYTHTFYTIAGDTPAAPAAPETAVLVNRRAVSRVVVSEPDTYFTYPHENGFWRETGDGDYALVVAAKQQDGKLRLDRFDPNPAVPLTKPLLVTEGMRIYYTVADPAGLAYYTKQTGGGAPSRIYEGNLRTGKNRLLYEAPAGWQISQSCNITNDGAFVFARIYNVKNSADNKIFRVNTATGAVENLLSPPFLTDHIHCSPFDNNWVLYCHSGASYESQRMWAWHATEAPQGRALFAQKDAQGRSLYNGHEVALHHRLGAIVVVFGISPGRPAGLYEINFDGTSRCVSPNDLPPAWHCNAGRDGRWAVVDTQEAGGASHIYAVNFATGARQLLCRTSASAHPWHPHPHISPDDKWVVFNDDALKKVVALEIDQPWLARFAPKQ
jgi:hypothetical protein